MVKKLFRVSSFKANMHTRYAMSNKSDSQMAMDLAALSGVSNSVGYHVSPSSRE